MSWHVDPEALGAYATRRVRRRGRALDRGAPARVRRCRRRRAEVDARAARRGVGGDRRPARRASARARRAAAPPCRRARAPARLLAATPSLPVSWLVAVALALAFAVVAAPSRRSRACFCSVPRRRCCRWPASPPRSARARSGLRDGRRRPVLERSGCSCLRGRRAGRHALLAGLAAAARSRARAGRRRAWLLPALALTSGTLALATYISAAGRVRRVTRLVRRGRRRERRRQRRPARRLPRRRAVRSSRCAAVATAVLVHRRDRLDLGRSLVMPDDRPRDGVCKRFGRTPRARRRLPRARTRASPVCSAPTARARPRCCASWRPCWRPTRDRSRILGRDPPTRRRRPEIRRRLGYLPQEPGFYRALHRLRVRRLRRDPQGADRPAGAPRRGPPGARAGRARRRAQTSGSRRSPAACGAGWRSPRRCSATPSCSCSTSRPPGWTPSSGCGSASSCHASAEDRTVLLSTHQTEDVAALCRQVVVLDAGARRSRAPARPRRSRAGPRVARRCRDDRRPALVADRRRAAPHLGDAPAGAELVEPTVEDGYLLLLGGVAQAVAA